MTKTNSRNFHTKVWEAIKPQALRYGAMGAEVIQARLEEEVSKMIVTDCPTVRSVSIAGFCHPVFCTVVWTDGAESDAFLYNNIHPLQIASEMAEFANEMWANGEDDNARNYAQLVMQQFPFMASALNALKGKR